VRDRLAPRPVRLQSGHVSPALASRPSRRPRSRPEKLAIRTDSPRRGESARTTYFPNGGKHRPRSPAERLSRRSHEGRRAATALRAIAQLPPIARAAIGGHGAENRLTPTCPTSPSSPNVRDEASREVTVQLLHRRAHVLCDRASCRSSCARRQEGDGLNVVPREAAVDQAMKPGRRQRRHLRVRQPGRPRRRPDPSRTTSATGPPAGRTSSSSVRRVLYSSLHRQRRGPCRRITYQFQFPHDVPEQGDVPYPPGRLPRSTTRTGTLQFDSNFGLRWSTRTSKGQNHPPRGGHGARRAGEVLADTVPLPSWEASCP